MSAAQYDMVTAPTLIRCAAAKVTSAEALLSASCTRYLAYPTADEFEETMRLAAMCAFEARSLSETARLLGAAPTLRAGTDLLGRSAAIDRRSAQLIAASKSDEMSPAQVYFDDLVSGVLVKQIVAELYDDFNALQQVPAGANAERVRAQPTESNHV